MLFDSLPFVGKITIPRRQPATVVRQRLLDVLKTGLTRRLVVLSAAAGYGKTTLLVHLANSEAGVICWYTIDAEDSEFSRFTSYLAATGKTRAVKLFCGEGHAV